MPINFECPNCWKQLEFPDDSVRKPVQCRHCAARFTLPRAAHRDRETFEVRDTHRCPSCKLELPYGANYCNSCYYDFRSKKKIIPRRDPRSWALHIMEAMFIVVRWTVRVDERSRWTLSRRASFFFIPGRTSVFDLKLYASVHFHYSVLGGDSFLKISLRSKSGRRIELFRGWSPKIADWFEDILCRGAGLDYISEN